MYTPHFVYSFICQGTLGCFHLLAIVNNAAVDMTCKYLFETLLSSPLDLHAKSGIAKSYGDSIFNFLKN